MNPATNLIRETLWPILRNQPAMIQSNMKKISVTYLLLLMYCSNSYSQNLLLSSLDTSLIKRVKFEIKSEKTDYNQGEKINIQYTLVNISDANQKILMKDYYGFPMGMGTSILDINDSSICKYPSRHLLASQIFFEKDLKNDFITLKPGKKYTGELVLQDVPVFEDYSRDYIIPSGKYTVLLTYYSLISNKIMIEINK